MKQFENLEDLGARIKQIRKSAHLTQQAFGETVKVSDAHISSIEKGKDKPSDLLINLIAIKYNVNEQWIKFGTGPVGPNFTQAALNTLRENRKNNNIYTEVSVSLNSYYTNQYMEIVEALCPSGAIPDFVPFMESKELIDIFNYLQYSYINAEERDRLKIEIKFETAYPDFKEVITKLTEDHKAKTKEIITLGYGSGKASVQATGRISKIAEDSEQHDTKDNKQEPGTGMRQARELDIKVPAADDS